MLLIWGEGKVPDALRISFCNPLDSFEQITTQIATCGHSSNKWTSESYLCDFFSPPHHQIKDSVNQMDIQLWRGSHFAGHYLKYRISQVKSIYWEEFVFLTVIFFFPPLPKKKYLFIVKWYGGGGNAHRYY